MTLCSTFNLLLDLQGIISMTGECKYSYISTDRQYTLHAHLQQVLYIVAVCCHFVTIISNLIRNSGVASVYLAQWNDRLNSAGENAEEDADEHDHLITETVSNKVFRLSRSNFESSNQ